MNKPSNEEDLLRTAAEELLARAPDTELSARPAEELLHELQVYQIELEMQNDELRRAQIEQEESRDRYLDLYEFAPDGYLTLSHVGTINEINLTGAKLLGVERGRLMHQRFDHFIVAEDRDRWNSHFLNLLKCDVTLTCELALQLGNGSRLYVQLDCLRKRKTDRTFVVRIMLVNITARKQAEEALRKSNENLRAILDNSPYMTWLKDTHGRYIKVNKIFASYTHLKTPERIIGLTDFDLWPNELAEKYRADDAEVMAARQQQKRIEEQSFDGTKIHWVETFKTAVIDENGNVTGTSGFTRDITERKLAEQKLHELAGHIQTVREEEKIAIAREIHNVLGGTLTSIKMEAHSLKTEAAESKDSKLLLDRIEEISKLVDHAMGVTRQIITGLHPTILDDLGILAALEWKADQFMKRTGIECMVNCLCLNCEECDVKLDKLLSITLFRIAQEALTNVARHSGASRVEIEFHCGDDEVVLSIIDNGRGMTKNSADGSAHFGILGMHERAKQLGGKIILDTPPGGGFDVTAIFPVTG